MNVWPVIERELRMQSRQSFTYWLRALGAGALVLACAQVSAAREPDIFAGPRMFSHLNIVLFLGIWILAPLTAADSISREKREGTLGILLLTPLRPRDVVAAKEFFHGWRILALLLGALPIMTIPVLMGGVIWPQMVASALIQFSSACWALSAGLVASALARERVRALIAAALLALGLWCVFVFIHGEVIYRPGGAFYASGWPGFAHPLEILRGGAIIEPVSYLWNGGRVVGPVPPKFSAAAMQRELLLDEGVIALISVFALFAAGVLSGWLVARSAKGLGQSARVTRLEKTLCTPVIAVEEFHIKMRRAMERNPVGWLQRRTWSSRLASWGWLAVITLISTLAVGYSGWLPGLDYLWFEVMAILLLGNMAISAGGSFHRERENGVLELLLVSPMREAEIIAGRVRGLWSQFAAAWILLLAVWGWLGMNGYMGSDDNTGTMILLSLAGFATLPYIGLYFSMTERNAISALLWTILTGLVLPWIGPRLCLALILPEAIPVVQLLLQLAIGSNLRQRLCANLIERKSALRSLAT